MNLSCGKENGFSNGKQVFLRQKQLVKLQVHVNANREEPTELFCAQDSS